MASQFVSEKELAKTYTSRDGWETVTQYREAVRLAEKQPELARAEIARRVGRSPSAVRGWLAENKTPRVVKGLETAHEKGWLNIEATSEQFRALNQLVAWIFSGGGISRDTFAPTFSADDQLALATLSHLLRWVDLSFRIRDHEENNGHFEVTPSNGASVFGRVLHVLGAPCGIKAEYTKLTFPQYLSSLKKEHKRDFGRIYLLNRGSSLDNKGTAGVYLQGRSATGYNRDLHNLYTSITTGAATLGAHNKIWVSADAVRDLAGGTPLRPALATRAAFGTGTPPDERAFASTFRQQEIPGGYQYLQLYKTVTESRSSHRELAEQTGIPKATVKSWREGSKPYVKNALSIAYENGWLPSSSAPNLPPSISALLGWILARGSIRKDTYYPIFGLSSSCQQAYFETIAEELDLKYSVIRAEDSGRSTEIRIKEDGTVLGRILYILGAPLRKNHQNTVFLPVYLYYHSDHAEHFVRAWMCHHGTGDELVTLTIPPKHGKLFTDSLEELIRRQCPWSIERTSERELMIATSL